MRFRVSHIFFYLCTCFFVQAQQEQTLSFSVIKEELFNGWISSIAQDSKGFIWIGTQDGLHRYDGYRFEVLRNSPETTQSLAANWIRDIAIDANNDYWLATFGGGVSKFSPKNKVYTNFSKDSTHLFKAKLASDIIMLGNDHVMSATDEGFTLFNIHTNTSINLGIGTYLSLMTRQEDMVWLVDKKNKLFAYKVQNRELTHEHTFDAPIQFLKYIPEIGLVIGFDHKLALFKNGTIEKEVTTEETITKFTANEAGNYVAGNSKSLFQFYPEKFQLTRLRNDLDISQVTIETIFLDRRGSLWVGTNKGLYKEKEFNNAFLPKTIKLHARRLIKKKNDLYIGGVQGLFKYSKGKTVPLMKDISILSMLSVGDTLYCSSDNAKIYQFANDSLKTITPLSIDSEKKLRTMGLAIDQQKRLWVSSWQGLHVFDQNHQLLKFISLDTGFDNEEAKIINIYIDSKDSLWIITSAYGIFELSNVSELNMSDASLNINNYRSIKGDVTSLTSDIVTAMGEDQQGNMWFGTDIGVLQYREDTQNFRRLQYQGKLFDRKVMSLRSSGDENLWMTTINDGVYRYNTSTRTMQHFTKNDGLISNAFLYTSGFYDENGSLMYFGTDEGVQVIDLSGPFSEKAGNKPIITAFKVNGETDEMTVTPSQAPFLKKITLAPDQNDFSVDFSAMDYINPNKIKYSYRLDDAHWRIADLQTAYFTNVPYGNHVLNVRTIHDGVTNEEGIASLNIYIAPPWYLSLMAKFIYALLCIAAAVGVYNYLKWRIKIQFSLKLKEEEATRLKKLNDFKSKLYTNIAHEFKTPLTLIAGPVQQKLQEENISDSDHSNFSMIKRNTKRLTSLVDQVLDLAKLENGKLQLQLSKGNLGLFLHAIAHSFDYQANLKQIDYTVKIQSIDNAIYDEDIIEKITTNLLSNAFKYCPEKGHCSFAVTKQPDHINISVKNTTVNGSKLNLEKLFTRFYQYDDYAEGMGVGLSLVKELVTFYKGKISTKMEPGEMIHFELELPLKPYQEEGGVIRENSTSTIETENMLVDISLESDSGIEHSDYLPVLLIVEDQAEIRAFIKNSLKQEYQIVEAENGKIGLEIAESKIPDIIISDVRMPLIDGIQLCSILKKNELTDHIPIILLTANSEEENELKGLSSGADAFMSKPFNIRLLEQRVDNLLETRKTLRNRYSQEFILKPKDIAITPSDETFLNKIQEVLDLYLTDPQFNAELFSKKAGMSRMQLHRKLLNYTGLSTSAFIRSQRLKQALHILSTSDATINEVAYAVGFNTPSYFMKCFKESFKKTPTEYLQSID